MDFNLLWALEDAGHKDPIDQSTAEKFISLRFDGRLKFIFRS